MLAPAIAAVAIAHSIRFKADVKRGTRLRAGQQLDRLRLKLVERRKRRRLIEIAAQAIETLAQAYSLAQLLLQRLVQGNVRNLEVGLIRICLLYTSRCV